jgi:preprotein translocase subunit SecF
MNETTKSGIIEKRLVFYLISILLIFASLFFIFSFKFEKSIDFYGGAQIEILIKGNLNVLDFKNKFEKFGLKEVLNVEGERYILKFNQMSEEEHQKFLEELKKYYDFTEESFTNVSPLVGKELRKKTFSAILIVLILISLYITFAFRKKVKPISSFIFGLATLIALFHDVLISLGFVAFNRFSFDINIVVAILTLAGFSVHDTIVVFDRIRENIALGNKKNINLKEIINFSIKQTIARSINTSLTTILALIISYFIFGYYVKSLILTLIFGIVIGTYSSIFIASPLVYEFYKNKLK